MGEFVFLDIIDLDLSTKFEKEKIVQHSEVSSWSKSSSINAAQSISPPPYTYTAKPNKSVVAEARDFGGIKLNGIADP